MNKQDYSESITVNAEPHEAFISINNVSKWWTENVEGSSEKLHDEFTVQFGDVHFSRQKLVEVIPDEKVVWLVTESKLNFLQNKQEWTNTKISFEISKLDNTTQIHFTHIGLVPDYECFNDCSNAWRHYLRHSLLSLVNTGKGYPTQRDNKTAAS
jgi:hypothetical protein